MIILKKEKKSWKIYPIGKPKGAINSKRTPEFIGTLKFSETNKGMSINKFIAKYPEMEEKLLPPGEAMKLFKSQAVFLVSRNSKMEEFLKINNIKVRFTKICNHCSYEGNITIINSNFSYDYQSQTICKLCAEDTIKRELKLQGYDKKSYKNFKRILDKTGDLTEVLKILDSKFDPISNSNLTLFDKINVQKTKIPQIAINRLKIPKEFKKVLNMENNKNLLPVQYLAIKQGLLRCENLLVVSATASGKTLVGELAGIPKAMGCEKFIFLTPLVALANQKYRDFKKRYEPLGLKVSIKVGMNRVKAKEELKFRNSNIKDADIIVGTYEGIDFLLRSGHSDDLNTLGCVLIDEIHTLDDEDRGTRLNGMIKRIRNIFSNTQLIALSATVKNPKELASEFNMKLVEYSGRPVPLERHIIYLKNEIEKKNLIRKLILKEYHIKSSKGYYGQTIVFTNSRRKTHQIADYLSKKRIKAEAYHAGLSYFKKEKIEKNFANGKISTVITTSALAAGVDFPASQVIFETLIMGNKWITANEFSQMLGRAGRPSYHDRGVVYLLPEIANKFDNESEEAVAISLLESDVDNINVEYNEADILEQLLADISSKSLKNIHEIEDFYKKIKIPIDIDKVIDEIYDKKLITIDKNHKNNVKPTKYGKAVSMSFLAIDDAEFIKKSIFRPINKQENIKNKVNIDKSIKTKNNSSNSTIKTKNNSNNNIIKTKDNSSNSTIKTKNNSNNNKKQSKEDIFSKIINIAIELRYFENAYISPIVHRQIVGKLKTNFSSRLFADSTLDIISSGETINKLDTKFQEALLKIQVDFLRCECSEKPFCDCLQRGISEFIIKERLKKKDPIEISRKLLQNYQIQTYSGDIFSWLDNIVRNLEAIERIANAHNKKNYIQTAKKLIRRIEKG